MFKLALYAALHSAPDEETKAAIQAIFDQHYGGVQTNDTGGGTGQGGPPAGAHG
jgi:hypothetical protein